MTYKQFAILLLFLGLSYSGFAQNEKSTSQKPLKDRIFLGGDIGASFGNYTTVTVAPVLGMFINPKMNAGIGIEYQYTKDKRYDPSREYNDYGLRAFTQYSLIPQLYLHAEFAEYNYQLYNPVDDSKTRKWVPHIYLGGGYRQYISRRTFVNFQILVDVLNNENSPFEDYEPQFSIGFGVGI